MLLFSKIYYILKENISFECFQIEHLLLYVTPRSFYAEFMRFETETNESHAMVGWA